MTWHEEFEDESSQKGCSKTRRTIWNWRSSCTSDLSIKAFDNLEDPQHVSCNLTMTLHQKQNLWKQLSQTASWITRGRRSIWSRNNPQTSMERKRILILCEMEKISDHQGNMGIWTSFLEWWKHASNVQRLISTLNKWIYPYWTIKTKWNPEQKTWHTYKQDNNTNRYHTETPNSHLDK